MKHTGHVRSTEQVLKTAKQQFSMEHVDNLVEKNKKRKLLK